MAPKHVMNFSISFNCEIINKCFSVYVLGSDSYPIRCWRKHSGGVRK